jgi:hypothetical protein
MAPTPKGRKAQYSGKPVRKPPAKGSKLPRKPPTHKAHPSGHGPAQEGPESDSRETEKATASAEGFGLFKHVASADWRHRRLALTRFVWPEQAGPVIETRET